MNLAVVLGSAITSAVLTGALLVGDSVRGSLYDLTLERLGKIDYAFVAGRPFDARLAERLGSDQEFAEAFGQPSALFLLPGSAVHAESQRRATRVSIQGIDPQFLSLFGESGKDWDPVLGPSSQQGAFPPAVINRSLQQEIEAEVGDFLLVSVAKHSEVNPEFLLGSRDGRDLYGTLRVQVVKIVPDSGVGRFSLNLHQHVPRNVFVPLSSLQRSIDQEGSANTLLVEAKGSTSSKESKLREALKRQMKLSDYGLELVNSGEDLVLESREMIISPSLQAVIEQVAAGLSLKAEPVLTYLANTISSPKASVPYSTVSALDLGLPEFQGQFQLASGAFPVSLSQEGILLNDWTASQLGARLGDAISLSYFVVDWREELTEETSQFRLEGIVSMTGIAVDGSLTPKISGVQEADDMASWDPPIPIDLNRIRVEDEEYWDRYRAAPKAYVPLLRGRKLWKSRFGETTSFRLLGAQSSADRLEGALLERLSPDQTGQFLPVKEKGLEAASGATDFGMLFMGFSLFLIVSSVFLVALLFRLGVEQRVREIGTLLSLGFPMKSVRGRFLREGLVLASVGIVVGLAGAVGYAWLLVKGLSGLWVAAVGSSSFLFLHIGITSLAVGGVASLAVISLSITLTFRSLSRLSETEMLAGKTEENTRRGVGLARWVFSGASALVLALLGASFLLGSDADPILFFGIGAGCLLAGLSFFSTKLRTEQPRLLKPGSWFSTIRTAARDAARNPRRSLLSTILVATACFVIVAVAANRSVPGDEVFGRDSGAGGYALRAEADIPLVRDLNNSDALFELGFSDQEAEELRRAKIAAYRLLPGEDVSCQNLYRPGRPRLLGVAGAEINRGGFQFQGVARDVENPWTLLEDDLGPDVIPAIGDMNSVTWILHRGLGQDLIVPNELGEEVRLRIVGLLHRSIFQSELLISEANFRSHFPKQSGQAYFLIEAPEAKLAELTGLLEKRLSRFGFDVVPTSQVLADFLAVENTYLSTFQLLGGLGLLLGTLGLAIVLVRNTIERKADIAALSAFGFTKSRIANLILLENCFLLVSGMGLGTGSALIAVLPHLLQSGSAVEWGSLAVTLLTVLLVGALAAVVSVRISLRSPLLPALRGE